MTIGIYAKTVNHFIETLAYFISLGREPQVLLITDTSNNVETSEHPWCLKRLKDLKAVEIVPPEDAVRRLDRLYIHMSCNHPLWDKNLNKWLRKAKNIGCLRESHYLGGWKKTIKELLYSFPYYLSARSIVLQDGRYGRYPYFFIQNRSFYSPSVHPQFFNNKNWGRRLFDRVGTTAGQRAFKFAFIGTRNPPEREALLLRIKKTFNKIGDFILTDIFPPDSMSGANILWVEYDNHSPKRGLNPALYAEALGEADFSVCPLGWSGNWTHRVVESLLRGTIPILEDEKRYNIGLEDMGNCIVVKSSDWPAALKTAFKLDLNAVHKMRSNILRLREQYLLPQAAALRLKKNMKLK